MPKYKRREDGRFRARVWDGSYTDSGRKHYIDLYSTKSSRDLELKVIEFETKKRQGYIATTKNVDIYEYSLQWLKTSKAFTEETTQGNYTVDIRKIKALKGFTFETLTYNTVQNLINTHAKSPAACIRLSNTFKSICISAERDKILPRGTTEDIYARLVLPKYNAKPRSPLSKEDKECLKNPDLDLAEKTFLYLLYYTGMRRNEILALEVTDITDKGIVVNKALGRTLNYTTYLKTPKSKRGNRTIPIHSDLREILNEYIPTLEGSLLFSYNGKHIYNALFYNYWRKLKKKTGIVATPHNFRHNFCTMLCYQAATERTITTKKIAELLGDTEEMVLKVYSHIVEEKENVTEAIENALKL